MRYELGWHMPRGLLFGMSWKLRYHMQSTTGMHDWDVALHFGPGYFIIGHW